MKSDKKRRGKQGKERGKKSVLKSLFPKCRCNVGAVLKAQRERGEAGPLLA